LGNLWIDGWLGGLPVIVRTHWERVRATKITVTVGSSDTASEMAKSVDVAVPHPANGDARDAETKRLLGLATWHPDIAELRVTGGIATAELLLDDAPRVAIDVGRLRELVDALHAIRGALDPSIGPYR